MGWVESEWARGWLEQGLKLGGVKGEFWEFLKKWAWSHFRGFKWGSCGLGKGPVVAWGCRARLGLGLHGVGWM